MLNSFDITTDFKNPVTLFTVPRSLVIIPTYNERENILKIIDAVFALDMPFHILIVDDGSPDGTAQLVKNHQVYYPDSLHIVERKGKLGLGTAYIAGFRWGIERDYDYICEMDADFSHSPTDLPRLVRACTEKGANLSVGSRYVKGGDVKNWTWDRILLSYGASWYVRAVTWLPVADPTAGFVCYSREVLEAIDLDKIRFIGYAFQIEMKFAAHTLGYIISEVPIKFVDRVEGVSKMNMSIFSEAIKGVLQMRWASLFDNYSNKQTGVSVKT
ncbi:MAG: polyprenol monophosphomannose synthase [Saprospiraceae bacterium]|nr:polyprenol monophosphomannose synthase [Saprospiraceae bacterium]